MVGARALRAFTRSLPMFRSLSMMAALAAAMLACSSGGSSSTSPDASASSPSSSASASPGSPGSPGSRVGGIAKKSTCKNESLNKRDAGPRNVACDDCEAVQCAKEFELAVGTDPNTFGGVCGEYLNCTCDCSESDKSCFFKCPDPSDACKAAINAGLECAHAKCAAECGDDF